MNKKEKDKIKIEFANASGMLASRFSLSPTVGQIYGLLYLSQQPVSLSEMVEKLGISKGSASTNVRVLESWNAVKKVWVDNSRKDYYEANPDTLDIVSNRVKKGIKKRLMEVKQRLKPIEDSIKQNFGLISKNSEFYNKRINNIKKMYNHIFELLEILS